jgi:pimeloyl-ACP methyl ester carboxylesterase
VSWCGEFALFLPTRQARASPTYAQDSAFFTTSDGVKIHYLTMGNSGSWVVLIHGYTDSAQRMWFTTGIAPAQDVVELMDHLKIAKAHIHGYSMGGGLTGQLLAMIPQRFITAGLGGSGIAETDPALRAQAAAMDDALPKPQCANAEAMNRFRARVTSLNPTGRVAPPVAAPAAADLRTLAIPIIAINGSFDAPYAKTHRLWREARVFENIVLPDKTHLTAIAVGGPMPPQYVDAMSRFIDAFDEP